MLVAWQPGTQTAGPNGMAGLVEQSELGRYRAIISIETGVESTLENANDRPVHAPHPDPLAVARNLEERDMLRRLGTSPLDDGHALVTPWQAMAPRSEAVRLSR